jgi:hypothetical protein
MGRDLTAGGRIGGMDDDLKDPKHTAYVRREIEAGLRDSEAGRTVSVEKVRERFGLSDPHPMLAAWHKVYEGLSDEEIAEVEAIALRRNNFSRGDAG